MFNLISNFALQIQQIPHTMNVGDKAPETLGLDQDGKEIKLSDFAGRKLVLYFYPKDSTSGCTAEACNLRDNYSDLRSQGYEVVGVSIDSAKSHLKFIEKNNLPFTLIADTDKTLVEQMGVWGEKSMYGRKYMGTFRTTFIIDENGVIQRIIGPKEIKTKDHAAQILK
jgi:peroxiredoxin Q/BCP